MLLLLSSFFLGRTPKFSWGNLTTMAGSMKISHLASSSRTLAAILGISGPPPPRQRIFLQEMESPQTAIFSILIIIEVHLVIFRMRKSILYFVSTVLIALGRWKGKASLPLKQSPPGSCDLYLLVQFMLRDQFTHNATYRPHLNRGIIVSLHQDNLRSAVPSTHHVQS